MEEPNVKPQYKLVASYYCGECAGNAEQSVIRAGYSKKYARGNAHKLVARPEVQQYIAYLNSLTADDPRKHVATIAEIQSFWTEILITIIVFGGCLVIDIYLYRDCLNQY